MDAPSIETLSQRYQREWNDVQGRRLIQEYLHRVPATERPALLRRLLEIDIRRRQAQGQSAGLKDYRDEDWFVIYEGELRDTFQDEAEATWTTLPDPGDIREPPPPLVAETGGRRIGNYVLLQCIGSGGMGEVYLARHHRFANRRHAIKLLRTGLNSRLNAERFEREIETMGQLSHPNLVFAHDAGNEQSQLYLVMDYIDGVDLQRLVDDVGGLPIAAACELVRLASLGIAHAHDHHIIHRDIKPSNILLSRSGEVKVLDLGLANLKDESTDRLTADGIAMGTASYMSPEQWRDAHNITFQSDIYSLGCTLYCLLTGRPPFSWTGAVGMASLMQAHLRQTPEPVRTRRGEVPLPLSDLVDQALVKDPAGRFASAREFAQQLQPFCDAAGITELVPSIPFPPVATPSPPPRSPDELSTRYSGGSHPQELQPWSRNVTAPALLSRPIIVSFLLLTLISSFSLWMAYFGPESTETWRERYGRLGGKAIPAEVGFAIELVRMLVFVGLTTFVIGTRFASELHKTFNLRKWSLKLVAARVTILLFVGLFVLIESRRHLLVSEAPAALAAWGVEHGIETTPAAEAGPYAWYLPYSLINYIVVLGGLFSFPLIRFWFSDHAYMLRQRKRFAALQRNTTSVDAVIRNLHLFAIECRTLTVRYIDVLGALSVGIHYEFWVGFRTQSDGGKSVEMLGWLAVGMAAAMVLAISCIYARGFSATSRIVAERGSLEGEMALGQLSLPWFLKTTIVYEPGGIAVLSLVLIAIWGAAG